MRKSWVACSTPDLHGYLYITYTDGVFPSRSCIAEQAECCGDDGSWCAPGSVCTDDGFCETGVGGGGGGGGDDDDEDDDVPTTTRGSTPTRTPTAAADDDDDPTPTADFGDEDEDDVDDTPTTTRRSGAQATRRPGEGDEDDEDDEDGEKKNDKNSANQMKLSAGGLMAALVAGAAMFL
jgi:hypothetical protein